MNYEPQLIVKAFVYILTLWFFLCLFSDFNFKNIGTKILFVWISINLYWLEPISLSVASPEYLQAYIVNKEFLIKLNASFALMIAMFLKYDKSAWKYASLLSFATVCHIVIILSLRTKSYGVFYLYYDELLIITNILIMVASKNGIITALRNIQGMLHWVCFDNCNFNKGVSTQKKRKAKA